MISKMIFMFPNPESHCQDYFNICTLTLLLLSVKHCTCRLYPPFSSAQYISNIGRPGLSEASCLKMRRIKKSFSMQTNISYNKVNAFYTSKMKSANSYYNINKHMDHQRIYLRKFQIIVLIILIYETCVLLFKQPAAPYHQLGMIKGKFLLQFFIEHFNDL